MITSQEDLESNEKIKVLVADADSSARLLLKTAISEWGYEIAEASDGEEAWEILHQANPPQLLILDWLMPKLDGISLCARIKKKHILCTYTILLTESMTTTDIIRGLAVGADEFLPKPFNMAELRGKLSVGTRIIKFENALAERNKSAHEYTAIMDALKEALSCHNPEKATNMLNSLLETEIKKFGGKLSIETNSQSIRILIDLPYLKHPQ